MTLFKRLNRGGKIIFICIMMAVVLIVPMSIFGYVTYCIHKNDVESFVPLTFKQCPSVEKGIIFTESGIEVHKDVFFCNAIVEREVIPQKTTLYFPHDGVKISPIEENSLQATYAISHKTLYAEKWHIVSRE